MLARGSEFISEQVLVADLQGRLKGLDVHEIYQTGRSYIWYIEFTKEEDVKTFIQIPAMTRDNYTASIPALNEQRTTVKIFWLPTHVRESFVRSFLAPYGKVMDVTRERVMLEPDRYCLGGTYTAEMVLLDRQKMEIPYLVKYDVGISMLITMAGRPPLCLKCNNIGHIRKNCPENLPRTQVSGIYAAAAGRMISQTEIGAPTLPPPPQHVEPEADKPPKTGRSVPPEPEVQKKDNPEVSDSEEEKDSNSTLGGVTTLPETPEAYPVSEAATSPDVEVMETVEGVARTAGVKRNTTESESVVRNIAKKYADDEVI